MNPSIFIILLVFIAIGGINALGMINAGKRLEIAGVKLDNIDINWKQKHLNFYLTVQITNPSEKTFRIVPQYIAVYSTNRKKLTQVNIPGQMVVLNPGQTTELNRVWIQVKFSQIGDVIFHTLRQQLVAKVYLKVNGFQIALTEHIYYYTNDQNNVHTT